MSVQALIGATLLTIVAVGTRDPNTGRAFTPARVVIIATLIVIAVLG
jgi:hypothetical protein